MLGLIIKTHARFDTRVHFAIAHHHRQPQATLLTTDVFQPSSSSFERLLITLSDSWEFTNYQNKLSTIKRNFWEFFKIITESRFAQDIGLWMKTQPLYFEVFILRRSKSFSSVNIMCRYYLYYYMKQCRLYFENYVDKFIFYKLGDCFFLNVIFNILFYFFFKLEKIDQCWSFEVKWAMSNEALTYCINQRKYITTSGFMLYLFSSYIYNSCIKNSFIAQGISIVLYFPSFGVFQV